MALHSTSLPRQHRSTYEIRPPALTFRSFLFWSKTLLLWPQYSERDINSDNVQSRLRAVSRIDLSWLATSPCVSLSVSLSQVPLTVHCNQHLEVCTLEAIFKTSLTRAPPQARVRQDVDDPDYLDQVPPASPSLSPGLTASAPPWRPPRAPIVFTQLHHHHHLPKVRTIFANILELVPAA